MHFGPGAVRHETPARVEGLKRPFEMAGFDRSRVTIEPHQADIALVERMKGDSHCRGDEFDLPHRLALSNGYLRAPGQELRIAFDIGDDRVHLLRRVRKNARFLMKRHATGSAASRQARGPKQREVFARMI